METDDDYTTYFVEYACKQSLMGFATYEYVDIFTKDGKTLSDDKLASIKANIDK